MYSLVNRQTILSNKAGFGLSAAGWALPSMLPREEIALNGYEGGGKRKNVRKSSAEPTAVDDGPALPHESSCYHEIRRAEESRGPSGTRRISSQSRLSCQVGYSVKPEFPYHFSHLNLGLGLGQMVSNQHSQVRIHRRRSQRLDEGGTLHIRLC